MRGVARRSENHPPFPVIVRPAGDSLGSQVLVAQPVKVLAPENNVLRLSEGYLVSPIAH